MDIRDKQIENSWSRAIRIFQNQENVKVLTGYLLSRYKNDVNVGPVDIHNLLKLEMKNQLSVHAPLSHFSLNLETLLLSLNKATVEAVTASINKKILDVSASRIMNDGPITYERPFVESGTNANANSFPSLPTQSVEYPEDQMAIRPSRASTRQKLYELQYINGDRYLLDCNDTKQISSIDGCYIIKQDTNQVDAKLEVTQSPIYRVDIGTTGKYIEAASLDILNEQLYESYHIVIQYIQLLKRYSIIQLGPRRYTGTLKLSFNDSLCMLTGFNHQISYEPNNLAGELRDDSVQLSCANTAQLMDIIINDFDNESYLDSRIINITPVSQLTYFNEKIPINTQGIKLIINVQSKPDFNISEFKISLLVTVASNFSKDDEDQYD